MSNDFATRIKALRLSVDMRQQDFADEFEVTQSAVALWEKNRNYPNTEVLIKISDYFGVSTDYLLGISDKRAVDAPAARPIAPPVRPSALAEDEAILLEAYRTFSPGKKKALFQMLEIEPEEKAKNNII